VELQCTTVSKGYKNRLTSLQQEVKLLPSGKKQMGGGAPRAMRALKVFQEMRKLSNCTVIAGWKTWWRWTFFL